MRVGTTTATRQIPVSELLARHRGEQPRSHWDAPTACETTDVIPVVEDDYYLDEPYAVTGYSEAYEYVEEPANAVRPFVGGLSQDTDRFPLPVLHNPHAPDEQTLLAPIDVEAMDAAAGYTEIRRGVTDQPEIGRPENGQPETECLDVETAETAASDDRPSREIYIRELLRREGRLPREQRRKQAPKIAAAAAGVAALCGAVAASVMHIQSADHSQNNGSGNGVPLTVVDGGGPHGQPLDAPLAPRDTEAVTPDNNAAAGTTTVPHATKPRVAPYVQANQKAQQNNHNGTTATSSSAAPTTTTQAPPSSSSNTPTTTTPTTTPSSSGSNSNLTPSATPSSAGHSSSNNSTPPTSTTPTSTSDSNGGGGALAPLFQTISGVLG